jgi:hypothetical protein
MCTMLCVKKPTARANATQGLRKELEFLYARRSAIDALIESLESYNRSRARVLTELRKRKTA